MQLGSHSNGLYRFQAFGKRMTSRRDPTNTTAIRVKFDRDIVRRLNALKKAIRLFLIEQDQLGLKQNAFEYGSSSAKVGAFQRWLDRQVKAGLLETSTGTAKGTSGAGSWANVYVRAAYDKGVRTSGNNLKRGGMVVKDRFIDAAFNRPIHIDAVGLIYTRTYTDLEGITASMGARMSSTLAQGIATGQGVREISKGLEAIADMTKDRARRIARTEVIRAYADATLNTFSEVGINDVNAEVEFSTAGDMDVCPQCDSLNGKVYTVSSAAGVIPVHPNCRCAWLPVVPSSLKGKVIE